MNVYWGDIHNHCDISYGHGSLQRALKLASQQLDFVSITGHAYWPDMPRDRKRYGSVIDYHLEGFKKLHAGWSNVQDILKSFEQTDNLLTFPGFEWHSCEYGDHNVIYKELAGPLVSGRNLSEFRENLKNTGLNFILEPHHIGYLKGGRGVNWDEFDPEYSPIAEIFSLHGCSESTEAPYPMLGTMGSRDQGSTAQAGLNYGHKFGFVASTDQHSGYPGSYGDGRVGVLAERRSKSAIWDALFARRTFAVTGDKIIPKFQINDAEFGGETVGSKRSINIGAVGNDWWKSIDLIKNGRILHRWAPVPVGLAEGNIGKLFKARIRVEWGWYRPSPTIDWDISIKVEDGAIRNVETCFRGDPVVRRDETTEISESIPCELLESTESSIHIKSKTVGNPTTRHSRTQSVVLSVEMPSDASLEFQVNGKRFEHSIESLMLGSRSHFMVEFPSPSFVVHRAIQEDDYVFDVEYIDEKPQCEVDYYYVRMEQMNGQCAWVSPIWVR